MGKRIGVVGGGPAWRRGVAGVLADAGFETAELTDLAAWRPGRGGHAVALRCSTPDALASIEAFVEEHPRIPVVAVMPDVGVPEYASAVRTGAIAAIADDDDTTIYALAFAAAFADRLLVPPVVIRALVARLPDSLDKPWLDVESVSLLRHLASGATVAALANRSGYSEREMFRMLRDLYTTIGVESRTQAIIWATRHGLLDEQAAAD